MPLYHSRRSPNPTISSSSSSKADSSKSENTNRGIKLSRTNTPPQTQIALSCVPSGSDDGEGEFERSSEGRLWRNRGSSSSGGGGGVAVGRVDESGKGRMNRESGWTSPGVFSCTNDVKSINRRLTSSTNADANAKKTDHDDESPTTHLPPQPNVNFSRCSSSSRRRENVFECSSSSCKPRSCVGGNVGDERLGEDESGEGRRERERERGWTSPGVFSHTNDGKGINRGLTSSTNADANAKNTDRDDESPTTHLPPQPNANFSRCSSSSRRRENVFECSSSSCKPRNSVGGNVGDERLGGSGGERGERRGMVNSNGGVATDKSSTGATYLNESNAPEQVFTLIPLPHPTLSYLVKIPVRLGRTQTSSNSSLIRLPSITTDALSITTIPSYEPSMFRGAKSKVRLPRSASTTVSISHLMDTNAFSDRVGALSMREVEDDVDFVVGSVGWCDPCHYKQVKNGVATPMFNDTPAGSHPLIVIGRYRNLTPPGNDLYLLVLPCSHHLYAPLNKHYRDANDYTRHSEGRFTWKGMRPTQVSLCLRTLVLKSKVSRHLATRSPSLPCKISRDDCMALLHHLVSEF